MFYHASPVSNMSSIIKNGISAVSKKIYLSPTPEDAVYAASQWHGDKEFAVFTVAVDNLDLTGFNIGCDGRDNMVIYGIKTIPPKNLKFLRNLKRL